MTSPIETATDHQMMQEDDANMPEFIWNPAGTVVADDPQQPGSVASADPDAVDMGGAVAEPSIAGRPVAEEPVAEEPVAEEPVAEEPVAVSPPVAEPEPTLASPVASDSTSSSTRWHEILAMFVDDPRSSAELAAGLVDENVDLLVVSVRERQRALLSGWRGDDAGTEEMRAAVQHYRTFASRLEDFSREA
jgi:hypothetical protein